MTWNEIIHKYYTEQTTPEESFMLLTKLRKKFPEEWKEHIQKVKELNNMFNNTLASPTIEHVDYSKINISPDNPTPTEWLKADFERRSV